MSKPFFNVQDFTKDFYKSIAALQDRQTLVGIPENKDGRKEDGIGNAALLYINEFGSPAQNIPARHPMKTGIRLAQGALAAEFKKCAQAVFLSPNVATVDQYLNRAGIIASNSIKSVINQNTDMDPPADATLRSRKYLTKKKVDGVRVGFEGTKALVVTGQMRNAITYVVKDK